MKEVALNSVNKTKNYRRFVALVDDEDFERVNKHKWQVTIDSNTCYALTKIEGKTISMHKFITGYKMTDHKNHDGLDNQRDNLREATPQQNNMNSRLRKDTSSNYKGVHWRKDIKKWQARIQYKNKRVFLGNFLCKKSAGLAYNNKARELFGEYACLNKI